MSAQTSTHGLALAAGLVLAAAAAPPAHADSLWTPHIYNLGTAPLIPVTIVSRASNGDSEEDLIVRTTRRAPVSDLLNSSYYSPQAVFHISGDALRRPAACQQAYTTVAGQPGSEPDLATATGARACYF